MPRLRWLVFLMACALWPAAVEAAPRIHAGSNGPAFCRALSMALDGTAVRCHARQWPTEEEAWGYAVAVDPVRRELFLGVGQLPDAFRWVWLGSVPLVGGDPSDTGVHVPPWPFLAEELPALTLPSPEARGLALDLDARWLYATALEASGGFNDPSVVRMRFDGSGLEVLASGSSGLGVFTGIALHLAEDRLYWGSNTFPDNAILRSALDGSDEEVFHTLPEGAVGALALDATVGRLYWVEGTGFSGGAAIRSIGLDGKDARVERDDVEQVYGLALDPAAEHLYWSECGATPVVRRMRLDTSQVETIPAPACLVSLAIAEEPLPAEHAIAVADNGAQAVTRFDVDSWSTAPIASGGRLQGPRGVAALPDGQLVVADLLAQELVRVDPASGAQSAASAPGVLTGPVDVAVDGEGRLVVADLGAGALLRLAPDGGSAEPLPFPPDADAPLGVAAEPGGTLLATSGGGAALLRLDPVAETATPVSAGAPLSRPTRVALGGPDEAFVSDTAADTVLRIDLATGDAMPLFPGQSFGDPFGVAVDPNGDLLVLDRLAGQLVRVDPRTGARRALTRAGVFADPRGLAILPVPAPGGIGAWAVAALAGAAWLRSAGALGPGRARFALRVRRSGLVLDRLTPPRR